MNAMKLGIHKLVYKHGSASPEDRGHLQAPVSPREKCAIARHLNWLTQNRHLNWPVDTKSTCDASAFFSLYYLCRAFFLRQNALRRLKNGKSCGIIR